MKKIILFLVINFSFTPFLVYASCLQLKVNYSSNLQLHNYSCSRGDQVSEVSHKSITFEQETFYGPDCNLRFASINNPSNDFTINVQQNFKFLVPGNVSVKFLSGNRNDISYVKSTGSCQGNGSPGFVSIAYHGI